MDEMLFKINALRYAGPIMELLHRRNKCFRPVRTFPMRSWRRSNEPFAESDDHHTRHRARHEMKRVPATSADYAAEGL